MRKVKVWAIGWKEMRKVKARPKVVIYEKGEGEDHSKGKER